MRLSTLRLSVLVFYFQIKCLLGADSVAGLQNDFPFTTVVDILSQNPEFSTFLRLLQTRGHIPYINELQNFTLLAPVNSAFITSDSQDVDLLDEFELSHYIISENVLNTLDLLPGVHILKTDSFPLLLDKGNDGDCRLGRNVHVVDPDLAPNFQNATVQGIDSFITSPPSLYQLVKDKRKDLDSISIISHFFEKYFQDTKLSKHRDEIDLDHYFNNKTIFLPTDDALREYFNDIELSYLFDLDDAEFPILSQKLDIELFLKKVIVEGIIGGVVHRNTINVKNLNDEPLILYSKNKGHDLVANGSLPLDSNSIYDRGIVHFVSHLPLIEKDFVFNVEKYLLGLNASSFVEELHLRDFEKLIRSRSIEQTIFVTKDNSVDNSEISGFSKSQLLYHFIESRVDVREDLKSNSLVTRLYDSMFCSSNKRLGGKCQRLKISRYGNRFYLNEKYRILSSDPVKIDKTLIYTISDDILLPGDLVPSINPFYHCSKSLKFMQQLNLLDLRPNNEGYTLLLPCFNSWDNIQLNAEYLQRNISAMNILIKSFILEGLVYSDKFNYSLQTKNLYGDELLVKTGFYHENQSSLPISLSTVDEDIYLKKNMDMIFNQGVIHPIDNVFFPQTLDISLRNLIETVGTLDFLVFLEKFPEYKDILTGSAPYSLLIPTPRSLLMEGIDLNYTKLESFLKLHILPENQTMALLNCADQIDTAFGKSLKCREASDNVLLLSLLQGLDKEVRILKKGCTSGNNNSCVFLIDRPISLQWLNKERYNITLPGVSFALGIVLGIMFLFSLLLCLIVTSNQRKYPKILATVDTVDEDSALVPPGSGSAQQLKNQSDYQSTVNAARNHNRLAENFESSYSINARTAPMMVSQNMSNNLTRDSKNISVPNIDVTG